MVVWVGWCRFAAGAGGVRAAYPGLLRPVYLDNRYLVIVTNDLDKLITMKSSFA